MSSSLRCFTASPSLKDSSWLAQEVLGTSGVQLLLKFLDRLRVRSKCQAGFSVLSNGRRGLNLGDVRKSCATLRRARVGACSFAGWGIVSRICKQACKPTWPTFQQNLEKSESVASYLTRTNASIAGHQARLRQLVTVDLQFRLESEAARRPHETTEVVKRRAHGLGVCVAQACPLQMNKMQTFTSTFVNLWIGCCYAMAKQIIDTDFIEQKSTLKGLLWWQLVRMTAKLNLFGSQG